MIDSLRPEARYDRIEDVVEETEKNDAVVCLNSSFPLTLCPTPMHALEARFIAGPQTTVLHVLSRRGLTQIARSVVDRGAVFVVDTVGRPPAMGQRKNDPVTPKTAHPTSDCYRHLRLADACRSSSAGLGRGFPGNWSSA